MKAADFLCRTPEERERLLDMSRRLRPAKLGAVVLLLAAAVVSIPVYGWRMQLPLLVVILAFAAVQRQIERTRHPEIVLACMWLFAQIAIVVAIGLASGPRIYTLSILVVPMLMAAAVFPARVVAVGTAVTAALMLAAAYGLMGDAVLGLPPVVIVPTTVLLEVVLLASRTVAADQAARQSAVIDQLTGLLNRAALQARAVEMTARLSAPNPAAVAAVVADIDHFKAINDRLGHAVGDRVLAEVARRLARAVDQDGWLYRYGGEEFVVLLEGEGANGALALAERLREAVSGQAAVGLSPTLSVGVAYADSETLDCAALLARADRALYAAKAAGRDRVCLEQSSDPGSQPSRSQGRAVMLGDQRDGSSLAAAAGRSGAHETSPSGSKSLLSPRLSSALKLSAAEREHMLDIVQRVTEIGRVSDPLALAALLSMGPWLGWTPLIPIAISVALMQVVHLVWMPRVKRAESAALAGALLGQVGAGLYVLFARHPLIALPLLTILIFAGTAAAPATMALAQTLILALIMTTVALLGGANELLANPSTLVLSLSLLGSVALFGYGIGQSTIAYRAAALVDPLTGMLSRVALRSHVAEFARRRGASRQAVTVLIADLDHFKAINDEHGHAIGDAVLAAVAERLRSGLRAFDSLYRIGGEEFMSLLMGVDEQEALMIAGRLRRAIRERPIEGVPLTVSIGLATSVLGAPFSYDRLFSAADAALLDAKAAGRDRVLAASQPGSATAAA